MERNFRIRFLENPKPYFTVIRKAYNLPWSYIAQNLQVSVRTLTSWRSKETTTPIEVAEQWRKRFGINIPSHELVATEEIRKRSASIGGKARQALYGNLGTPAGRRRGGFRSWQTHKKNPLSPFVARKVLHPKRSTHLAELVGAILGDGMLTKYQLILYSNIADEREYAEFLSNLVVRMFGIQPTTVSYREYGVMRIICSRKNMVKYFQAAGLNVGNKTKQQVGVPQWIRRNRGYSRMCLRGLIDTYGCVYIDRHQVQNKTYESLSIAFTNASTPLLDFVEYTLRRFGYTPTRFGRHIRLRRKKEIFRYAKEIGFSNPKHARKIRV